jgi:hypothetical protein
MPFNAIAEAMAIKLFLNIKLECFQLTKTLNLTFRGKAEPTLGGVQRTVFGKAPPFLTNIGLRWK